MNWQSHGIALLEASLVRPLVLIATAWLVLRMFRVRHPASRHAVWTAVLVGMLVLPIVSIVTPHWTLAILPGNRSSAIQAAAPIGPAASRLDDASSAVLPIATTQGPPAAPSATLSWPPVETLVVWVYVTGLVAMLAYRLIGWALLRRVVSLSRPLHAACVRESVHIVTPVAVGVLRRAVILPAGWRQWNAHTRRAVLAHEFAHLRRGDTLVAALARFVKCVFWFHPVAWWVARRTSDLAELACDAVALQRVGDPARYSRVLMEFTEAVSRSGHRVALPGLAMASGSPMSERIDQVFEMSGGAMRKLARPQVWLAAVGLPALCVAATVALGAAPSGGDPLLGAQALQVPLTVPTDSAARPQFEVASIKPAGPMQRQGLRNVSPRAGIPGYCVQNDTFDPGHVYIGCYSLGKLIWVWAYGIPPFRVVGPAWMGDAASDWSDGPKFDIEAKLPEGASRDQIPAMLRELLATRFKLTIHREYREQPVYALVVAKGGLSAQSASTTSDTLPAAAKSQTSEPSNLNGVQFDVTRLPNPDGHGAEIWMMNSPRMGTVRKSETGSPNYVERYEASGITLDGLADLLTIAGVEPEPVVNATGEQGRYSITLEMSLAGLEMVRSGPHDQVDIQNALLKAAGDGLKKLGLQLERRKAPVEVLVIDNLEKKPIEK